MPRLKINFRKLFKSRRFEQVLVKITVILRESLTYLATLGESDRERYQTISSSQLFWGSFRKSLTLLQLTASHNPPPKKKQKFFLRCYIRYPMLCQLFYVQIPSFQELIQFSYSSNELEILLSVINIFLLKNKILSIFQWFSVVYTNCSNDLHFSSAMVSLQTDNTGIYTLSSALHITHFSEVAAMKRNISS